MHEPSQTPAGGTEAGGTDSVDDASDTVVFIPAWNEEENLPAVLDELASANCRAST